MPIPNDALNSFPTGVSLARDPRNQLRVSKNLATLLVESREGYRWPLHNTPETSQRVVLDLEVKVGELLRDLSLSTAHEAVSRVSRWAGNHGRAQVAVDEAPTDVQQIMAKALGQLLVGQADDALPALCALSGIDLVIATKIYRFCAPQLAAALDRHSSYFLNSLNIQAANGPVTPAAHFRRQWANGNHVQSRLATITRVTRAHNLHEYLVVYLPLLAEVASVLNRQGQHFRCAATGETKTWRPADIDMAAFYWWSQNGAQ